MTSTLAGRGRAVHDTVDRVRELAADAPGRRAARSVTPMSGAVAVVGLAAWLGAWRLGWEELAYLAGGCLVILCAAVVFTVGRAELAVDLDIDPRRVKIGTQAVGRVVVRNVAVRRMFPLRLETPVGTGVARVDVPWLAAQGEHDELFVVPTSRRAVIGVGPVRSVRGDPLGLFRREVTWTERLELFVHPAIVVLPGLTAGWIRDLEGRETNDPSASDVAFHALREYVPGDDRRHIHWRTSARLGRFMVRQFVDTRRATIALALSTSPSDYASESEFELAVSVVASVGASALSDGQDVTCVAAGHRLASHAATALLDGLSGVAVSRRDVPLNQTVAGAARRLQRASIVVLIVGGGVNLGDLRAAAARFPSDLRVVALRVADGASLSLHRSGAMTVAELGELGDLAPLLRGVGR